MSEKLQIRSNRLYLLDIIQTYFQIVAGYFDSFWQTRCAGWHQNDNRTVSIHWCCFEIDVWFYLWYMRREIFRK